MKKTLLLFFLASITTFAQITITSNDFSKMFTVGNEITIKENDGGGSVDIGQLGGNNIWDFSWFQGNLQLDMVCIDPATSPFYDEFPNTNIATYSVGDFEGEQGELWNHSYLNGSFNDFGFGAVVSSQPQDTLTIKNNPARIEAELPLSINSSWSHSYTQTIYINGVPFFSSQITYSVVADAYGTMILPGGESHEALRMKETMTIDGNTSVTYQFLSKGGAQVGVFASDSNPPDTGYIAIEGYSWNFDFSGGGSLDLAITHPSSNDLVIAGEMDSIKYMFYEGDVDLYYSLDEGQNFVLIDSNYNELGGVYYWDVPASLLTTKAIIKIVDSSPDSAESGVFKIKPWQLTRLDANEDFELYEPDQDGWNFCNCTANMWPPSWWQQFDYIGGTDPYTNLPYPPYFFTTSSIAFPDWPLFVDVFTEPVCYMQTPIGKMYRTRPLVFWIATVSPWGGSCFGFAVSSLLGFYHKQHLIQMIGNFGDLNSVPLSTDISYVVNSFQIYQYDKEYRNERREISNKTPRDLLAELKEMLIKENGDGKTLSYRNNNGSGGHAVVPYKLERASGIGKFKVRVYNPNQPDSTNQFIYIDSVANTWSDSTSLNFGTGSTNCVLTRKSESYLYPPNLKPVGGKNVRENLNGPSRLAVYNTINAEITITSSTGEQIGFQDSIAFDYMTDAVPIIPETGYFHPPIGYDLPLDSYTLEMNNFTDSSSKVLFDDEFTLYNYSRFNTTNNETDLIRYSGNGMKTINPDAEIKIIDLITIIPEDTISEKVFFTNNLEMQTGDSINVKEKDRSELVLNNFGSAKSYELRIIYLSANGQFVFENSLVSLTQNTGHQIVPDWNDLQNEPIKILIDLGNDGTIDDTIFVKNQATNIEDEGSLLSPDTYNLAQNYPNPFNPATSIRYSIPQRSNVSLKVYDILGNEVADLVNEEKDRGVYTVTFDATGFASGIYFYTIRADGFVQTKKMLLIK
jgi:hypothetical protein